MFLTCYNFEGLHSNIFGGAVADLNVGKTVGGRRNAAKLDKYANFKLEIVWCYRTHA